MRSKFWNENFNDMNKDEEVYLLKKKRTDAETNAESQIYMFIYFPAYL